MTEESIDRLVDLTHSQVRVFNGVIFGVYARAVPFIVPLTNRIDPRRIYVCAVGLTTCSHLGMAQFCQRPRAASPNRAIDASESSP
jgi:Na+/melibiose symporter-like transporter